MRENNAHKNLQSQTRMKPIYLGRNLATGQLKIALADTYLRNVVATLWITANQKNASFGNLTDMKRSIKHLLDEADTLARSDKYSDAMRLIDKLAEDNPEEAWIWRTRSYVSSRQGKIETAIDDISQAIAKCNTEPDFFYTRGILFFEQKQFREAVADFSQVIALCDLHGSDYYREGAFFFRADAYTRLKQYRDAESDCRHIRKNMQTWTDGFRTRADILAECRGS